MRRGLGIIVAGGLAAAAAAAQAQDAARFDGDWAVVLHCPRSPDGALPFAFRFPARVSGGVLHGENGVAGQPRWLALDGPIRPNGDAALVANGITGQSAYNLNGTGRGVPYRYAVSAHFEASSGTGQWVTTRTCVFTFSRS